MALVVDASVAVGWIARGQATPLTEAALSAVVAESGRVPAHFGIEVARALRHLEGRDLLAVDAVDAGLAQLRVLPLREDCARTLDRVRDIVALARRHVLRVADAAYLELALRAALPLATRDIVLARAAQTAGAALFKS
jgi:predicted nucleic acid-binding protein